MFVSTIRITPRDKKTVGMSSPVVPLPSFPRRSHGEEKSKRRNPSKGTTNLVIQQAKIIVLCANVNAIMWKCCPLTDLAP